MRYHLAFRDRADKTQARLALSCSTRTRAVIEAAKLLRLEPDYVAVVVSDDQGLSVRFGEPEPAPEAREA